MYPGRKPGVAASAADGPVRAPYVVLSLGAVTSMAGRVALTIGTVTFPASVVIAAAGVVVAAAVAFTLRFGAWLLLIFRIVLVIVGAAVALVGVAVPAGGVVVHPATQNIPTAARQTRQRIMRFLGDIALHPVPVVRAGIPLKIVRTRHLCITIWSRPASV